MTLAQAKHFTSHMSNSMREVHEHLYYADAYVMLNARTGNVAFST